MRRGHWVYRSLISPSPAMYGSSYLSYFTIKVGVSELNPRQAVLLELTSVPIPRIFFLQTSHICLYGVKYFHLLNTVRGK